MQHEDFAVDLRDVVDAGRTPVVQAARVRQAVRQPVGYGETAAAFQLRQYYYHLPATVMKNISTELRLCGRDKSTVWD